MKAEMSRARSVGAIGTGVATSLATLLACYVVLLLDDEPRTFEAWTMTAGRGLLIGVAVSIPFLALRTRSASATASLAWIAAIALSADWSGALLGGIATQSVGWAVMGALALRTATLLLAGRDQRLRSAEPEPSRPS